MKQRLSAVVSWVGHTYPGRLIAAFGASHAGNYASGMAFTAFVSMFPLVLGLLAIVGYATRSPSATQSATAAIVGFFPNDGGELSKVLVQIQASRGTLGIVGIVGLLWSGSSLFTGMEFSLGIIFGVRQRNFLRQRAMALVMTLLFVLALVATVAANALVVLPGSIWGLEPLVGLIVWCLLMLAIYRLVPNRTYPVRQLWPGVLIAGTAMEILTLAWPLYTHFSKGSTTSVAFLGLAFLLASWLYFLAEFILLGAVANRMHGGEAHARGLLGERAPRRIPVTEGSLPGGEVSPKGA